MATEIQNNPNYAACIQAVQDYVRAHAGEPLSRDRLAAVAGFSLPHFHRVFAAVTGQGIYQYVRRIRLERAGRKLRMGAVDITQVALAAGYRTHAAFSKAFKQEFGLTPSEFRQLGCQEATRILMVDRNTPVKG